MRQNKFNQFFQRAKQELINSPFVFPDSALKAIQLGKELDALVMFTFPEDKANILDVLKKECGDPIHFNDREEAQAYRACVVLLSDASVQLNEGTAKSDFLCKAAQRDAIIMKDFLAITTDCFEKINDKPEQLPEKYNPISKKCADGKLKYIFTVSQREAARIYDQLERLDQLTCYKIYTKIKIQFMQLDFEQGKLTSKTLKSLHEIEREIFDKSIDEIVDITNKQLFIKEIDLLLKSLLHSHFDCNMKLIKLIRLFHIVESAHILREEHGFFRLFSSTGNTRSYQHALMMIKEIVMNVFEKTRRGDLASEVVRSAKKILGVHRGRGPHFFATASEKKKQLMRHENFFIENKTKSAPYVMGCFF